MLSVGNTVGTSGAALSLDTRVAVGAGVFAVSAADVSAPEVVSQPETHVITTSEQKLPAYNAFEFSYRSDFGKIILLQQDVETGQEVTQVPTEYHLRQYAATQREQRVQLQQKLYKGSGAGTETAPKTVVTTTAKPAVSTTASTSAAPTSAPTAAPSASPSVAPSTVAAAAVAHVDIKA
jgi:hypothetical protein